MNNKLIVRLSNNLGNQMFMYASAYVFAKKLNREFFMMMKQLIKAAVYIIII